MFVHRIFSFPLSVALCTNGRVTPRYQRDGSGFAAGALLARATALSDDFALIGSNRIALWLPLGFHAALA